MTEQPSGIRLIDKVMANLGSLDAFLRTLHYDLTRPAPGMIRAAEETKKVLSYAESKKDDLAKMDMTPQEFAETFLREHVEKGMMAEDYLQ